MSVIRRLTPCSRQGFPTDPVLENVLDCGAPAGFGTSMEVLQHDHAPGSSESFLELAIGVPGAGSSRGLVIIISAAYQASVNGTIHDFVLLSASTLDPWNSSIGSDGTYVWN